MGLNGLEWDRVIGHKSCFRSSKAVKGVGRRVDINAMLSPAKETSDITLLGN